MCLKLQHTSESASTIDCGLTLFWSLPQLMENVTASMRYECGTVMINSSGGISDDFSRLGLRAN